MFYHKKGNRDPSVYYRKSGLWNFQVFPIFLFVGLPIAGFWAYIHALALVYSPGFFANAFYVLIFAILMARVDSLMVVHYGKVRSELVAKLLGYFAVACFFYLHYAFWIDLGMRNHPVLLNTELSGTYLAEYKEQLIPAILFDPDQFFIWVQHANKIGTWGFGAIIKGPLLLIFWGLELLLFFMTIPFNYKDRTNRPFCENTGEWFQYDDLFPTTFIYHQTEFIEKLEKADYSVLDGLKKVKSTDEHSQIRLFSSKESDFYITATNKIPKQNTHDENLSYKEMEVVKLIRIDKNSGKKLSKLIRDRSGD